MLSELRIFAGRDGLHDATPWALVEPGGHVLDTGVGTSSVPHAAQTLIIIPDDIITVLAAQLPKLPARHLKEALPAAVEDQLMTPVEKTDLVLLEHRPKSASIIAAWDLSWRDGLLGSPCVASSPNVKVVAESWGMPLGADEIGLLVNGGRCILRRADWTTLVDEYQDNASPPILIQQALRSGADSGVALHIFVDSDRPVAVPPWINQLGLAAEQILPFDWRTASYSAAPSLYSRKRLYLEPAAVLSAFRWPAVIALCWLAFEIVATTLDWGRLAIERRQMLVTQERIFRGTMGETAAMVDGPLQMQRRLDEWRTAVGKAGSKDLLVLLTRIGARLEGGAPPLAEIRYDNGQLLLLAQSADQVAPWVAIARNAGLEAIIEDPAKGILRVMAP